jgi:hypothetical protein
LVLFAGIDSVLYRRWSHDESRGGGGEGANWGASDLWPDESTLPEIGIHGPDAAGGTGCAAGNDEALSFRRRWGFDPGRDLYSPQQFAAVFKANPPRRLLLRSS